MYREYIDIDGEELEIEEGDTFGYGKLKKYRDEENRLHRVGGPAMKWEKGGDIWYKRGKRHSYAVPKGTG